MARLWHGCGLRLMEFLRLWVKDVDLEQSQVVVRDGRCDIDSLTMLPASLLELVKAQIAFVKQQHKRDLAIGYGLVEFPYAVARKYSNADELGFITGI